LSGCLRIIIQELAVSQVDSPTQSVTRNTMKIGAYQFKASNSIEENYQAILRGINRAHDNGVKILFFQECALTGYPPIEIKSTDAVDFEYLKTAKERIQEKAIQQNMNIVLGCIDKISTKYANIIEVYRANGALATAYGKRALWGWDAENFIPGNSKGIIEIEGLKIGIRICYETRFPEYFRELFVESIDVSFIAFCDVSESANDGRYDLMMSHIRTRAVENAFTVITSNSISKYQTAPTCVIDPDGNIICEAEKNIESLIDYEVTKSEINFGRKGRIEGSKKLAQKK